MTGQTVLHYHVGQRLGAGGMGEVYRADDTRLGRPVALKFLSPSIQADQESRQQLLREARAASALHSPNITITYDVAEDQGRLFIVMEYVEGEVLQKRIERGGINVGEAVEVAMQTADALDEAHSRGIIHRDIKSQNIMVTPRGLVKVLDFGIAKFMDARHDSAATADLSEFRTVAGVVKGTVGYMSPEQALGRPLDGRSDLFSLGVVLYQMLTSRLPFPGATFTEVVDKILHLQPQPPHEVLGGVPSGLSAVVMKSLQKDPRFRHQSARELYIDLRNFTRDMNSEVTRGSEPCLCEEPHLENAVAVMTFANITKDPSDDWIGSGIAETVTADLQRIRGLTVIGRARVFDAMKCLSATRLEAVDHTAAIDVGRSLGAAWIVGGGYQRLGPRIRITSQLMDARSSVTVRTVKLDGDVTGIFDLQDKIVQELTQGLQLKLQSTEVAELEHKETRSLEAYEAYSRGLIHFRSTGRDALGKAIELFEKAVELDPQYASAWSCLGAALAIKGNFLGMPKLLDRAIECARKAIELKPRLAMAHGTLGFAFNFARRFDEAIAACREAVRLDPQDSHAYATLGRSLLLGKGQVREAIAELEHAVRVNPEMGFAHLMLGLLHTIDGNLDGAEAACRAAIKLQESRSASSEDLQIIGGYSRLGYIRYLQGKHVEALAEYEKEVKFLTTSDHVLRERMQIEVNQKIGAALLKLGRREEAEKHFQQAIQGLDARVFQGMDDPFTRYYLAVLHVLRGDRATAFTHLAAAVKGLGAFAVRRARTDVDLQALRGDPEFERILGMAPQDLIATVEHL